MPATKIEILYGVTDGTNLIFSTSMNYAPGSVNVFRNGILLVSSFDDGFIELGHKRVQLKSAPVAGEIIQAFYLPV